MKTILKIFFIAVLLCPLSLVKAQDSQQHPRQRATPEERAKKETTQIKEQLSLTDAQAADYEVIALKYAKEQGTMFEKAKSLPRDSVMVKMKEIEKKKTEEVKKILTAEQQTKYEKFLQENRGRFGGRNRGEGRPPREE